MLNYPVKLTPDGNGFMATFRDIPEANTSGESKENALDMARDALIVAMDFYFDEKRAVPMPTKAKAGEDLIGLPLSLSAKIFLLNEMIAQNVRPAELADKLKTSKQDVHRLLKLRHTTKIDGIETALKALNKSLELSLS